MTSRDFAKLIGVSQSTVSRALNGSDLVSSEKKKYILQKAREYNFQLNSQAQSLRTNKTGTIGIMFPKHFIGMTSNIMLAYVYDFIQKEMSQYDYDIMVIYYDRDEDDFSSFERIVRKRKVDGFLVLRMELSDKELQLIEEFQVPCVFMMNAGKKIRTELNYFFSDSYDGGYLAGKYLGQFAEYKKIHISVSDEKSDARRRMEGFAAGLCECGDRLLPENIFYCKIGIDSGYESIREHLDQLKDDKVAIFAYSDLVAIGATQALKDYGIKVPEQAQILGMDDVPLASSFHPQISTIHIEVESMVKKACNLLLQLMNGEEAKGQEWIKPRLVERETTQGAVDLPTLAQQV